LRFRKKPLSRKWTIMNVIRTTLLLLSAAFVVSCGTLKPAAKLTTKNNLTAETSQNSEPNFLDVKAIIPQRVTASYNSSSTQAFTSSKTNFTPAPKAIRKAKEEETVNAESFSMLQIKYGIMLDVPTESIKNLALYQFIEEWYGTRYVFGGTSRRGIDCSSLMQKIYAQVYGLEIPRTAVTQHKNTKRIEKEELVEGDLIFFHTTRSGISHVGIYLGNNRFLHASSSRGVVISNLTESYYVKAYRACGKVEGNITEE
jgi:cell wall-associated NlpC family hydrolase